MNIIKIKQEAYMKYMRNSMAVYTDVLPDIAFGSSGERTEDYILHSTPR